MPKNALELLPGDELPPFRIDEKDLVVFCSDGEEGWKVIQLLQEDPAQAARWQDGGDATIIVKAGRAGSPQRTLHMYYNQIISVPQSA